MRSARNFLSCRLQQGLFDVHVLPISSHVAFLSFIFCPNCIGISINDRALEEKRARLGLLECVNHDLLQPYPVLHEKPGKKFLAGSNSGSELLDATAMPVGLSLLITTFWFNSLKVVFVSQVIVLPISNSLFC